MAWGKLGAMAISIGDLARAQSAFEKTLEIDPKEVKALAALNNIKTFTRNSRRTDTLRKIAKSRKFAAVDRQTAYNALGRIENDAGNVRAAFFNWGRSKAFSPGSFDAKALSAHVEDQCRTA